MKMRFGRGSVSLLIACTAAIVGMLAAPGTADTHRSTEDSRTRVKDTRDEQDYMRAHGIGTPEQAQAQWAAIDAAGRLQVALQRDRSDVFGGLWIEHEPTFAIAVGVLAGHQQDVQPYIDALGLAPVVRIEEVQTTLVELNGDLEAAKASAPFGIDFGSGIDQSEGRVVIHVDNAADFEAFAAVDLPDTVVVELIGTMQPGAEIYGGLALSSCTSGFSVEETNGTREGVTTAGHCADSISYAGTSLPWQDGQWSGSTDAQWHTTPGFTDPNKIKVSSGGTTRNVTSRKPLNQMVDGEPVCKFGKITLFDCGDIDIVPYNPGNGCVPLSNNTFAFVVPNPNAGDLMDNGDSGGPVFHNNPAKAYGQMICHTVDPDTGEMVFMPQNFLPNIGVQVDID